MRADMDKVVVERPRWGRGHATAAKRSHRRTSTLLGEDAPAKESMRPYRERKHFSDHLGPLRRFLSSNVGRPWDKVFSEISARITPSSTVQRHILGHLFSYVEVDVVDVIRGVPYAHGWRGLAPVTSYHGRDQFFVHPKSGLLLPAPLRERRAKLERDEREVHVVADVVYAKFAGLWFRPELADKPRDLFYFDVIGREVVRGRYARSKGRQLGKRELRALGLANDP
jgi:hypothetical protein